MSMENCETCNCMIDTDYNLEHLNDCPYDDAPTK